MSGPNGLAGWLTEFGIDGGLVGGLSAKSGVDFGQSFHQMSTAQAVFTGAHDGDDICRAASLIGRVLSEEVDESEACCLFVIETKSGWLNLNPAWLVIIARDGELRVLGMAREGLISQRTAPGAIARFEAALQKAGPA